MLDNELNLSEASEMTEEEARDYIESIIWPNGPVCPHCGSNRLSWEIKSKAARPGVYKCADCEQQFTVTVGTIMHGSHITLRQWVIAFHLMTSSKKGVSALQIQRNLGLGSYRSAWHLAHRIRLAMNTSEFKSLLKGTVEVDETYVGGKPRKGNRGNSEIKSKRGRGTKKVPVLALVERNGDVVSRPIERVNAKTLKRAIRENCHKDCCIMTDEWPSYMGIGKEFNGGHEVIRHNRKEYVRGNASTNTVESYFALLKRGIHGTFHHVSKNHLHRYCDEFSLRWNNRKVDDAKRTIDVIRNAEGKRLSYKPLINFGTGCECRDI